MKLPLSLKVIICLLFTNFYLNGQANFCEWSCDDSENEGCFSCDISSDLNGVTIDAWTASGDEDNYGHLCSSILPQNTLWYSFLAGTKDIEIDVTSLCPTGGALQMGLTYACWGDCLASDGDCVATNLNLSYNALVPGRVYYIWVNSCTSTPCDFDITVYDQEEYELNDLAAIGAYSHCKDECLTGDCGEYINCGNISEVTVCSGEVIELIALHEGNSSTDNGIYDGNCSIYPPHLDASFYYEIDNRTERIDQLRDKRSGPLLTMPIVTETTIIEITLDEVYTNCDEVEAEIWLDLVVLASEEEAFHYEVCQDDLEQGWTFPIGQDDPLGDGHDWYGPEVIYLEDVEDWNNGCFTFDDNEECTCNTVQTLCIDILTCNTGDPKIFEDYPWLTTLVNPNDCEGTTVSTYQTGPYTYLLIERPGQMGVLYSASGQKYCTDRPNRSCVDIYDLNGPIESWTCDDTGGCNCPTDIDPVCGVDGQTYDNACLAECAGVAIDAIGPCMTNSNDEIFDDYPWLITLVDPNDCEGVTVSTYTAGNYTYIFIEREGEFGVLYSDTGQRYCGDRANLSCIDAYNLTGPLTTWTCDEEDDPDTNYEDVFEKYPWMHSLVDVSDCAGTEITVYTKGNYTWLFVQEEGAFGVLYSDDGFRYCGDRLGFDCRMTYDLTDDLIVDQYTCHSFDGNLDSRANNNLVSKIFPNPSTGLFNILLGSDKNYRANIIDPYGREILDPQMNAHSDNRLILDLTGNEPGLYFLILEVKGKSEVHPLMFLR